MNKLLIVKDFIARYRKEWNISELFKTEGLDHSSFCDVLYSSQFKRYNGQKVSYEDKFNLIVELKDHQLIYDPETNEESLEHSAIVHDSDDTNDDQVSNYDYNPNDDSLDIDSANDYAKDDNNNLESLLPSHRAMNTTFIRASQSLKYPIYYVLNLDPIEPNGYSKNSLRKCLEGKRFDISSFDICFPVKQEPNKLLETKGFSTAATTISGLLAQPLMRIFPYLVPYDIAVQVATKFVLSNPKWPEAFKKHISLFPEKIDIDLTNWLAVKIKSKFTTRAKDVLIPLKIYPGKISSLDDLELPDKFIKKHKSRESVGNKTKPDKSDEDEEKSSKKPIICPQYFDYKKAILSLHRQHEAFKLAVKKQKVIQTENAREELLNMNLTLEQISNKNPLVNSYKDFSAFDDSLDNSTFDEIDQQIAVPVPISTSTENTVDSFLPKCSNTNLPMSLSNVSEIQKDFHQIRQTKSAKVNSKPTSRMSSPVAPVSSYVKSIKSLPRCSNTNSTKPSPANGHFNSELSNLSVSSLNLSANYNQKISIQPALGSSKPIPPVTPVSTSGTDKSTTFQGILKQPVSKQEISKEDQAYIKNKIIPPALLLNLKDESVLDLTKPSKLQQLQATLNSIKSDTQKSSKQSSFNPYAKSYSNSKRKQSDASTVFAGKFQESSEVKQDNTKKQKRPRRNK